MIRSETTPPPLLRLPVELHQEIISSLELQDRARLALTNRYFAATVQPPSRQEFLVAETLPWAISKELYACKGCVRFRHLLTFSDDMRKGKRGRHGVNAHTRFCVKCGVDRQWYSLGSEITIMGQPHICCKVCRHVTDRIGSKGGCSDCLPSSIAVQQKAKDPNANDCHYESDDDWAYSTKSCEGGKHSEEIYGVWPDF